MDSPQRTASQSILVGREAELSLLCGQLVDAVGGRGSLALISGEPGIGKTALVREISDRAEEMGIPSLRSSCFERVTPAPYGIWIGLQASYRVRFPVDGTSLPESLRTPESQDQLFHEMAVFITGAAHEKRLLLILEDIHWSDSASLDFLCFLAPRLSSLPIVVVCTYRDCEMSHNIRLNQSFAALARCAETTRLQLQPLDTHATKELVTRRYDLSPADAEALTAYLQDRTAGNPFFINEFLRTLETHEVLVSAGSGWQLGTLDSVPLPTLIQQVIHSRISVLSSNARQLLDLVAVAGEQFTAARLARFSRTTVGEVAAALSEAVNGDLLAEESVTGRFWFTHQLIRETVYESIPLSQRYAWHREIAETLAEQIPYQPERVAEHFSRGQDFRAVEWLIRAGDRARGLVAFDAALERYEIALRILDSYPVEESLRGWLLVRSADACIWNDEQRGLRYLDEAIEIAERIDEQSLLVASRWLRGKLHCLVGEDGLLDLDAAARRFPTLSDEERLKVVDGALRNVTPEDAEEFLKMSVTTYLAHYGHYHDALERVESYMLEKGTADFRPKHAVYMTLGTVHAGLGHVAEAHDAYSLAREFNRRHRFYADAANAARLELSTVHLVFESDLPHERRRLARQLRTLYRQGNERGTLAGVPPEWGLLPLFFLEGQWEDARHYSDQMIERGGIWRRIAAPVRGMLAHLQQDPEIAWSIIHQELPGGPWSKPSTQYYNLLLPLQRLAAELALVDGDRQSARDWIAAHQRWLAWSSRVPDRSEGQLLWARYHLDGGDHPLAADHARRALNHALQPRQPLAIIASRRVLADLALARGDAGVAEGQLGLALELARNSQAPYEEALTQLSRAEVALHCGDLKLGLKLAAEAAEVFRGLNAALALTRANEISTKFEQMTRQPSYPKGLTPREVDVLRCVAAGMTDVEISGHLSISHRTVGAHLYSIYTKLEVPNRTAATSVAKDLAII